MAKPNAALSHFAALVRKLREGAGFTNARSFYQSHGGRPFFGCTYKAYLNVEKGVSVPQPRLVEKLATALRVALHEARAREFALAYLRILIGFDEFMEFAVQTLADKGPKGGPPGAASLERSYEERAVTLTPAQSRLLTGDADSYWCFTILANDRARRGPAELAALLGFGEDRARSALKGLARAKLATEAEDGRWHCAQAGKVFVHPKDDSRAPVVLDALQRHWDAMADGGVLLEHPILLRASESDLRNYLPYLAQGVQSADLYSTREKGRDTAFFSIEAKVLKILPF